MPAIIPIDPSALSGLTTSVDFPKPERLVSGNPKRETQEALSRSRGIVSAGIWRCEQGAWRIHFADNRDEFFCVIEGHVRLTDIAGKINNVLPGQAAIIPAGFQGVFEVVEPVSKYYVVVDV